MIERIKLFLYKQWIKIRCFKFKYRGKQGLIDEQNALKKLGIKTFDWSELSEKFGFEYRQDYLFGFIPWDTQYDTTKFISQLSGDCEDIHRIAQVLTRKSYKPELLTYISTPFKKSHTICIYKELYDSQYGRKIYTAIDYNNTFYSSTIEGILKQIEHTKNIKVNRYVVQDLYWNITLAKTMGD